MLTLMFYSLYAAIVLATSPAEGAKNCVFVCVSLKLTFECRPEKLPDAPLAEVLLADVLLLDILLAEVPKPLEPEPMEPDVAEQESS